MLRVKALENQLAEAHAQINGLMAENRILKVFERRLGDALSKYEGTHAQLPLTIKSYGTDLRVLQTRLRRMKTIYRELENNYRAQSSELATVQKQHKHLLDLTKNKQLGEREKLSNQLEQAENTIKQQEKKIQILIKKIELQNKNHQYQVSMEIGKIKKLQAELKRVNETNIRLQTKVEKLKYQNYGGRRSYVWGKNQNLMSELKPITSQSKSSLSVGGSRFDQGDRIDSGQNIQKTLKPELVHGESEISDHTKDLQRNLMKQVHEDVIHKPNMLMSLDHGDADDSSNRDSDSGEAVLWLDSSISKLVKENDFPDEIEDADGSATVDYTAEVILNPFSLPEVSGTQHSQTVASDMLDDQFDSNEIAKKPKQRSLLAEDDDDEDVSSISSVSD